MQRGPHHDIARGLQVRVGIAMAALFCAGFGLISPAKAQLFGSSYTSTAPRDCRVSGAGNGVDDSATYHTVLEHRSPHGPGVVASWA